MPAYIWGSSRYYPYASWFYPPAYYGFGLGIPMGLYFGGGWGAGADGAGSQAGAATTLSSITVSFIGTTSIREAAQA
jgi:hypothetical protein